MPSFSDRLDNILVRNLAYFNYKGYSKRLNLNDSERVLEIGCGTGNLSRFLAKQIPNGELYCLDNSKYWIEKAKLRLKKFINVKFILEDILDFNKKDYFDIVVISYVLHDLLDKKRERAIGILRDSLKSNGIIYIREPTRKSHGISPEEINNLMLNGGFREISAKQGYSFPLKGEVYEGVFGI